MIILLLYIPFSQTFSTSPLLQHFNILSDLSMALLFRRLISLSDSICLLLLFPFRCALMSSIWRSNNVSVSCICVSLWYLLKMFILLCLSSMCLFAQFVWVVSVSVYCVCVLIIAFSHQIATKRGQVGTVPIYLFAYSPSLSPFSPHVKHRTLLLSTFPNEFCRPPSQAAWDMTIISLPLSSPPF